MKDLFRISFIVVLSIVLKSCVPIDESIQFSIETRSYYDIDSTRNIVIVPSNEMGNTKLFRVVKKDLEQKLNEAGYYTQDSINKKSYILEVNYKTQLYEYKVPEKKKTVVVVEDERKTKQPQSSVVKALLSEDDTPRYYGPTHFHTLISYLYDPSKKNDGNMGLTWQGYFVRYNKNPEGIEIYPYLSEVLSVWLDQETYGFKNYNLPLKPKEETKR